MPCKRSTDPLDYQRTPHVAAVMAKTFPNGFVVAPHCHERDQLIWASSGVMQVDVANALWILPTNRALWVPAGEVHSLRMVGTVTMRSLYIDPTVDKALGKVGILSVSPLLAALLSEAASWNLDRNDRRADLVTELVLDELKASKDQPVYLPEPVDSRLRLVCDSLRRDPGSRQTLEQWAEKVGASARTLARLFASETGMGFDEWRRQARLAAAMVDLAMGQPVGVIAEKLGYQSVSAFTFAFRRAHGCAPSEYLDRPNPQSERQ
jgi:AraC-like DNA-binding protein/quercetin dioxygenase-like cupin family protein